MLDKFDTVMRHIGMWVGLALAAGAIYGAGPFPILDQGVRLGGAIGAAGVIMLITRPLAGQFGALSDGRRILLWIVDLVLLFGFLSPCSIFPPSMKVSGTASSFWNCPPC